MDDGLVLNIATDVPVAQRHASSKKSGRWTDRLKTKRAQKRKAKGVGHRITETLALDNGSDADETDTRPAKRSRQDELVDRGAMLVDDRHAGTIKPPTQIISSLFSYNPKIDAPERISVPKVPSQPSNAPLASSSGFSELKLHPLLVSHLQSKMKITKPTSIQRTALPVFTNPPSEDMTERDVFIQSQTGSGKTLSFLLPIIHDLLPLSTHSYIDRSIGTLAVIIAPTRELAKQISDVLESLLALKLRPDGEAGDRDSTRYTRWLISGLLSGGATRVHEKARLRKGIPILVSTPGRLLDHLQNTSSFNVGKCRWLVLDEADRLMELGFEETIKGIIQGLDGRQKLAFQAVKEGKSLEVGGWDWERRRRTILCSATIREDVQKLAGTTLVNPIMIKAFDTEKEQSLQEQNSISPASSYGNFTPPAQLSQKYVVVPLKLRLVALVALLRSILSRNQTKKGSKIIVFFSCTDSVDFHWQLLGNSKMEDGESEPGDTGTDCKNSGSGEPPSEDESLEKDEKVSVQSPLLPDTSIYRLHGSLPTPTRLASLRGFSFTTPGKSKWAATSSVLLCTSVASRGLDLPLVRAIIQYDLATEGGVIEYVHRVGRTARAGNGGEAWSIVAPSESGWVKWVEGKMRSDLIKNPDECQKANVSLEGMSVEDVLAKGFGGKGSEYEARATDVQLSFERWVLRRKEHFELARRAFLSHMRAYSTHPTDEKHMFHIRNLHIGHLAKSFALREAPKTITDGGKKGRRSGVLEPRQKPIRTASGRRPRSFDISEGIGDAERRMIDAVRVQGRISKKSGMMISSGADEFQITSGAFLEKLVQGH